MDLIFCLMVRLALRFAMMIGPFGSDLCCITPRISSAVSVCFIRLMALSWGATPKLVTGNAAYPRRWLRFAEPSNNYPVSVYPEYFNITLL